MAIKKFTDGNGLAYVFSKVKALLNTKANADLSNVDSTTLKTAVEKSGAGVTVDSALSATSTNPVQNKVVQAELAKKAASDHGHSAATTSAPGYMSVEDKQKLDGIAAGANKTTVDSALSSSSTNPVQNKVINTALDAKAAKDLSNVENAAMAQKAVEAGMEGPIVNAESTDGVAYTATVDGVTELYDGLKIRILPQVVSASTSPTLNVNGLGAIRIAILSSFNNAAVVPAPIATWLSAMRPLTVTFHQMRSSATGAVTQQYWIVDWRRPSASSLYGQVPVENGGWYIGTDTTDEDKAKALEALATIGVAKADHNHDGVYAPAYTYGTTDLTAGTSALETGKIHFVYE